MSSSPTDRWPPDEPALQRYGRQTVHARPAFRDQLRRDLMAAAPAPASRPLGPPMLLAAVGLLVLGGWVLLGREAPRAAAPDVTRPIPVLTMAPPVAPPDGDTVQGLAPAGDPGGRSRPLAGPAATATDLANTAEPPTSERPAPPAALSAPATVLPATAESTVIPPAATPTSEPRDEPRDKPRPSATLDPTEAPIILPATPTPRWTEVPTSVPSETPPTPEPPSPPAP